MTLQEAPQLAGLLCKAALFVLIALWIRDVIKNAPEIKDEDMKL